MELEPHYTISGAIVLGLSLIAAAIRWSAGKFAKTHDRSISALLESAKTGAILSANFNTLVIRFDYLAARFNDVVEIFLTDSQRAKLAQKARASTLKIPVIRAGDGSDGKTD